MYITSGVHQNENVFAKKIFFYSLLHASFHFDFNYNIPSSGGNTLKLFSFSLWFKKKNTAD